MPSGTKIDDGFSTLIEFSLAPNVALWEKDVTPPGDDGGGPNDVTTMRSDSWRGRSPKELYTLSESGGVCAYDPKVYGDVMNMLNKIQLITITFPNGAKLYLWGWLNAFKPQTNREGEQPTATYEVVPSNRDVNGNEVGPVFIGPSSTTPTTTTTTPTTSTTNTSTTTSATTSTTTTTPAPSTTTSTTTTTTTSTTTTSTTTTTTTSTTTTTTTTTGTTSATTSTTTTTEPYPYPALI